ncbi:PH domain-containing protein [Blastococcus sp. BMG 814]|uniref:PH domain-containing protein n=1 Tax=Blastococcus carthaginiensis TaxID=3050034 RepID=A0ABT9ID19_9ACTN|nr:PH domain-containing protein [Blastococcus carthaginiensis]MDP5183476.1 PH domain-containing protein [Blastococcus carthaginiensis]
MTSPDVVLDLRPPRFSTALYGASVVVAVVLVVFVLTTPGPPLFTAVFAAFAVGITGYNTATVLSRVRAHADGSLEVRNRLQTRRLQRPDIDRVMVGRQGGAGSMRRVELLLTDGTVLHLVATETLPFPGQRQVEEQAAELRRWIEGPRPPSP